MGGQAVARGPGCYRRNQAGAAALACLDLQVSLGLSRKNIFVVDSKGVVRKGRKEAMDPDKERYAQDTRAQSLGEIIGQLVPNITRLLPIPFIQSTNAGGSRCRA